MNHKYLLVILAVIFISFSSFSQGQDTNVEEKNLREEALDVFMDSFYINMDYIRREIPYVNYVRDRKEADLHIMITRRNTGSGGREYTIAYIGQGDYEGMNETLVYNSGPDETNDETRIGRSKILQLGLMKYVVRTPIIKDIEIDYKKKMQQDEEIVEDRWKSWVFKVDVSGNLRYEESYNRQEFRSSFSANKITPDWRIELDGRGEYEVSNYDFGDGEIYKSDKNSYSLKSLFVKSLSDHWSIGGRVEAEHSTYSNKEMDLSFYPAIEYNLFPYYESTRRQLRFLFATGYNDVTYIDTTIYGKIREGLFGQQLTVAYEVRQPWGSITTSLKGNVYLHDLTKNNLRFNTFIVYRIYKGLSLTMWGDASLVRDQLNLSNDGATEEEILLRRKEIASNFKFNVNIGLSYTFGSVYNNVVNPRFGQSTGGGGGMFGSWRRR